MNFSFQQELTILTLIFSFCALSIPFIIIKDRLENHGKLKSLVDREFEMKLLVHSVRLLRNINDEKSASDSLVELSNLMEFTEKEFSEKFIEKFDDEKRIADVWEEFELENGTVLTSNSLKLPLKVDWREKKIISDVQNQGSCGSCFALAVIEAIESMHALKTSNLTSLSVQQMLDCNVFRMSCDGGDPGRLLKWLFNTKMPIQTKEDYPSLNDWNKIKICEYSKLKASGVKLLDYSESDFSQQEELILLYLAYQGPLIASINGMSLKSYKNKVVRGNCDTEFRNLNHVVQIVGYDLTADIPFYIVKNSWGLQFGESGFMKIAIGSNVCGIAERISAVVV